jgi:tetratricopeptide (TPR) repeat protein
MSTNVQAQSAAEACLKKNDTAGAIAVWEDVLSVEPQSARAFFAIAQLNFKTGSFEDALVNARRCLEIKSDHPRAADIAIRALVNLKDFKAAVDMVALHYPTQEDQARSQIPSIIATVFAQTSDTERAIALLRQTIRLRPEAKQPRLSLALNLARLFRFSEVEEICGPDDAGESIWLLAALAKARLMARDVQAARGYVEQMIRINPVAERTLEMQERITAIDREQQAGPLPGSKNTNVIALIAISFSGTTMLNSLLGSLPDCGAVSESSSITCYARAKLKNRHQNREADFSTATVKDLVPCDLCGHDCEVFDFEFRRKLQADSTNRFFKYAQVLQCGTVITSDKAWVSKMDPLERYYGIIQFRDPYNSFVSFQKRNHLFFENRSETESIAAFVQFYKRAYNRFLHEQQPQSGRFVLHWESFVKDPAFHLKLICNTIGLDFDPDVIEHRKINQHTFSGNRFVRDKFKAVPTKHKIRKVDVNQVAKVLFEETTAMDQDLQQISAELMDQYRISFGILLRLN